jgi:hypothetical protein
MSILPKTKFSGLVIITILFLILSMGILTVFTRYQNEQQLIKRGFITLQQNSLSVKSKIKSFAILARNKQGPNQIPNKWIEKGFALRIDNNEKVTVIPDTMENPFLISTSRFFSDMLDKSFFDEYIVSDSTRLFYKTFEVQSWQDRQYLDMLKKNIYLPANYNIFSRRKDSVVMHTALNTGFISKALINYKKYYQFVYPVKVNEHTWYISGLISNRNYLLKKQHVETWVLIFVGILLIFTLFSFQFIKLFLLTKTEKIRTSDIVMIYFSISGIACIATLLVINLYTLSGLKNNTGKQLKDLNASIKNSLISELNLMYTTVAGYEKTKEKDFTVKSHVLTDACSQHALGDTGVLWKYPYFKGLLCSNKDSSNDIITTWENDSPSRISYRQYFRRNGEWTLPWTGGQKRFMLESIYSNTSGDVMAVLSKPSASHSDTIYCISSVMYSLFNTVLPPGFEFRIIGKDGMVWFHNDPKKNNRENFLDECDHNNEIQEAMHNRVAGFIPLQISLKNYQSYITPIGTLPLFLITLSDTREQNEFLSHVNYILFIFILIGICCALVSAALFYYEQLTKGSGDTKDYDAEPGLIWLLPDWHKNRRYMIILGLNVILGLFILVPVFLSGTTMLHFLLILFSAYSIGFMYTYFLLKTFRKGVFKKSIIIIFSIILFFCNVVYFINLPHGVPFFTLELLAVVIAGGTVYIVLKNRNRAGNENGETDFAGVQVTLFPYSKDPFMPYVIFVCSWIAIASVLPTIVLFKIAGREEGELLTRKNQLDLATKIERKNLQIDSFYIAHIYPRDTVGHCYQKNAKNSLNAIKGNLKLKGNYLLDLYEIPNAAMDRSHPYDGRVTDNRYTTLSRNLRQMLRREDIRSYQMLYGAGLDSMWFWRGGHLNGAKSDTVSFCYSAKQKDARGNYSGYRLKLFSMLHSQNSNPVTFGRRLHFFQAAMLSLFFLFLFLLIRIVIKRLFIPEEFRKLNRITRLDKIEQHGRVHLISTVNQDLIREFEKASYAILRADHPGEWKPSDNNLLLFYPLPEKVADWNSCIRALDRILTKGYRHTLILSCYSPGQIFYFLDEFIQHASDQETRDTLSNIRQKLIQFFADYSVYYYSGHLAKKTSQYQYLWEQCTINEKFILYDLAVDLVVNIKNLEDILNLIGKGMLEVKGKLDFADRGFKQFIEGLSHTDELQILEQQTDRADGWNKIKTPLYIIFAAVVIFFFFTQQDIISGLFAAILSIGGFFTAIWKLGIFGKSAQTDK